MGNVFVSSSSDTRLERARVIGLIDTLGARFNFSAADVSAYAYERDSTIGASAQPIQNQIRDIGGADIDLVVFILGERVGLPLPPDSEVPQKVRQLIDSKTWRSYFTYHGQQDAEPDATPLTGTLYELFAAIAFDKKAIFLCKGPHDQIFNPAQSDVWERCFGNGDYCRSFNLRSEYGANRAHTDEERRYLHKQLLGVQRLYDYVLAGRELHAFKTLDELEHVVSSELKAHWLGGFDRDSANLFLGLEPFGISHAEHFWGRESDTEHAINELRARHANATARPRLLITGRSGVGKSSFAAAGLASALANPASPGTQAVGIRFKPVIFTPGAIAMRVDAGACEALAVAREIAEATDERLQAELDAVGASAWTPETLLRAHQWTTELRNARVEGALPWLPLVIVDQVEDAFGKGGGEGATGFEKSFGPVLDFLDQLTAKRLAWVVYVLSDTSRPQEKSAGWLQLWRDNETVARLNAQSPFGEPLALEPLSPDTLLKVVESTFTRAGVDVASDVLRVLRLQINDALTSDRKNGFAFESILPLVAASMQLSERKRIDRLSRLVAERKHSRDEPISRAAWLVAASQDVLASSMIKEKESQLSLEDLVPLDRSIEVLAERAFASFVCEGLGVDWDSGDALDGELRLAPRNAELLLHKLLRWLVSQPDPDSEDLDWSKLATREEQRAAIGNKLGEEGQALIEELVKARLLRTERQLLLRLSHIALVRHWRRARSWCEVEHDYLRTYADVQKTRGAPSPAQLKAFRSLYAAWGVDGPWRTYARRAAPGPTTDKEWLRAQIRDEALSLTNPDAASVVLFSILRAGDDDLGAEVIERYAASETLIRALDIVCHPNFDPRQPAPIVLAAEGRLGKSFALLAQHAKRPFAADRGGQSAFHKLAANGRAEDIALLAKSLKRPAKPNRKSTTWEPSKPSFYGWTPLHLAAKSGSLETVGAIAEAMRMIGPRPAAQLHQSAPRYGGATALHFAARQSSGVAAPMLRVIMEVTQGPSLPDPRGVADADMFLPLHVAAASDDYEAVALLFSGRKQDATARANSDVAGAAHTPLSLAARRGASRALQALLDADVLEDGGWAVGKEALRLAAGYGHEAVVTALLARGQAESLSDLLDTDGVGRNAVHLAAQFRRVEALRRLLEHPGGPTIVNAPDRTRRRTALHWACFYNDPAAADATVTTIRRLIDSGADRGIRDSAGITAFQLALRRRVKPAYEALAEGLSAHDLGEAGLHDLLRTRDEAFILRVIESCPQPWLEIRDSEGRTLLHRAAFFGLKAVVAELVRRAPGLVNAKSDAERSPIHEAACSRSPSAGEIVELLANYGADILALDDDQRTALHCASFNANAEAGQRLIRLAGAKGRDLIGRKDRFGKTATHCAAEAGDADAVALLIRSGADPRAKADESEGARTPAHLAAYYGNWRVLEVLADVPDALDERTSYGDTILHCAAAGSRLSAVDWLIANQKERVLRQMAVRAAANDMTPYGAALMGWAKLSSKEKDKAAPAIAPASAQFKPTAGTAWEVAERLKDLLPPVFGNALPEDPTMAVAAIRAGDANLLRSLVEQGAPVVAPNHAKFSPLHSAIEVGDERMARDVLGVGERAAATGVNHHGRTPLHLAALLGLGEIIAPLIDAGAPIEAEDDQGRTAADLALSAGYVGIVDQLRERAPAGAVLFKARPTGEVARELYEAIRADDPEAVRHALSRAPSDQARLMALKLCCAWGAINTLKAHFSPGDSHLLAITEDGDFALLRAVRFGRAEVLEWIEPAIVEEAASMLLSRGETLLHLAARSGNTANCKRLAACGADPAVRDGAGRTPLHRAALGLHPETAAFLAQFADARRTTDVQGRTALHSAASVRTPEGNAARAEAKRQTIAVLLEAGLDPLALDGDGLTAEEIAGGFNDSQGAEIVGNLAAGMGEATSAASQPELLPQEHQRRRTGRKAGAAMLVAAWVLGLLTVLAGGVLLYSPWRSVFALE